LYLEYFLIVNNNCINSTIINYYYSHIYYSHRFTLKILNGLALSKQQV